MNIFDYIKDTKGEMKHVSWPTRKQTFTYTALVVLVSVFSAFYLGLFDHLFTIIVDKFLL